MDDIFGGRRWLHEPWMRYRDQQYEECLLDELLKLMQFLRRPVDIRVVRACRARQIDPPIIPYEEWMRQHMAAPAPVAPTRPPVTRQLVDWSDIDAIPDRPSAELLLADLARGGQPDRTETSVRAIRRRMRQQEE